MRVLRACALLCVCALLPVTVVAQAQTAVVNRAFDLEQAGRMRDAIAAWRQVIAAGQAGPGVLGLERVFSQLAQDDSVLPTLDSLLVQRPADQVLRAVQLRVLRSLGRERDAREAFDQWVKLSPHDPVPYREYASELLGDGRAAAADTVLQEATASLGSTKALTIEVAQLRAALGLWTGGRRGVARRDGDRGVSRADGRVLAAGGADRAARFRARRAARVARGVVEESARLARTAVGRRARRVARDRDARGRGLGVRHVERLRAGGRAAGRVARRARRVRRDEPHAAVGRRRPSGRRRARSPAASPRRRSTCSPPRARSSRRPRSARGAAAAGARARRSSAAPRRPRRSSCATARRSTRERGAATRG